MILNARILAGCGTPLMLTLLAAWAVRSGTAPPGIGSMSAAPTVAPSGMRGLPSHQAPRAAIVVDIDQRLHPIDPLVFGANHRWAFGGFGSWSTHDHAPEPGFIDLLRASGVTTLRFPGGTIANLYHWRRAIGPPAARGRNVHGSARDGQPLDNDFGPDEYGRLMESFAGVGDVVVDFATGSAAEAADWVDYMTGTAGGSRAADTAWAELRAANGHAAPYDVRYWEVGNEMDLPGQRYWRAGESRRTPVELYAFGGSARLVRETVGRMDDHRASAAVSTGAGDQQFFVRYPPVVVGSQTVSVGGHPWRQVPRLAAMADTAVYELDAATGKITFGDGIHGTLPPRGALVTATYTSGPHDGFVDFQQAMKRANPRIRVCAAATGLEGLTEFVRLMGREHPFDCITQHPYIVPADVSDTLPLPSYRNRLFDEAVVKAAQVRAARDTLRRYGARTAAGRLPEVVLTEYGHLGDGQPSGVRSYHRSLDEGLLLAASLAEWIRLGVPLADRANLTDFTFAPPPPGAAVVGAADNALLSGPAPDLLPQATALVLGLFRHMTGTMLVRSEVVDGPAMTGAGGKALPVLDVVASTDSTSRLFLVVTNRDADRAVDVRVRSAGFEHRQDAEVWTVDGPAPLSSNTPAAPGTVHLRRTRWPVGRTGFDYRFPPHSVTGIALEPRALPRPEP